MLFGNHISRDSYDIDWKKVKPQVAQEVDITEQHHLEVNGVTSYLNKNKTHELEVFQDFYRYMQPKMESFIFNDLEYPKGKVYIQNAWLSKYTYEGYVKEHTHDESVAVSCLYLEHYENSGHIKFKKPFYDFKKHAISALHPLPKDTSWFYKEIEVKQNDVLMFDSFLLHKSQPNLSEKERWTLTTNYGVKI